MTGYNLSLEGLRKGYLTIKNGKKRKLEELDLGVQPSSDKASINFVEYPIEGGREINKVTFKNPL